MSSNETNPTDFVDDPGLPGCALVHGALVHVTLAATGLVVAWLAMGLVNAGGLAAIDHAVMVALHETFDPSDPIGPPWLDGAMRDISALGSNTVLVGLVAVAAVLLAMTHRLGPAVMLASTTAAVLLLNVVLKSVFGRVRPDFLADSVMVETSSFPSSHAMISAVVYLLLAGIAAREMAGPARVVTTIGLGVALVIAIGFSRVYLGAHWPSDVLAGWLIGALGALVAWRLARAPKPPRGDRTAAESADAVDGAPT